jgi:hypothetical protein
MQRQNATTRPGQNRDGYELISDMHPVHPSKRKPDTATS